MILRRCNAVEPVVREKSRCNGLSPKSGKIFIIIFIIIITKIRWHSHFKSPWSPISMLGHHIFDVTHQILQLNVGDNKNFLTYILKPLIFSGWNYFLLSITHHPITLLTHHSITLLTHSEIERWNWSNLQ